MSRHATARRRIDVRHAAALPLVLAACAGIALAPGARAEEQDTYITLGPQGGFDHDLEPFTIPAMVPGDRHDDAIYVTNGFPHAGTLRAWLLPVELLGDTTRLGYQEITVAGHLLDATPVADLTQDSPIMSADDAADQKTPLFEAPIAAGEQVPVTLSINFPTESVGANAIIHDEHQVTVAVRVAIEGDDPASPPPNPSTDPPPCPSGEPSTDPIVDSTPPPPTPGSPGGPGGADPTGAAPTTSTPSGPMPPTGTTLAILAAAAALTAAGTALSSARRRISQTRRDTKEAQP